MLVCMPYGPAFSPSIGLSLLKAALAAQGVPARVRYFSLDLAERLGRRLYVTLSTEGRLSMVDLAGEWTFAPALFGPAAGAEEAYFSEVLDSPSPALRAQLRRVRGLVPGFLDRCLDEVLAAAPRIVGFTSVFQQHVASLALARRIKEARPETFVVFGGANCEAVMGAETLRRFPFVDAAVSGEGDFAFPELVRRVLDGRPVAGLPGVRTQETVAEDFARGRFDSAPLVRDLDALPYPDYSDFFAQFAESRFDRDWQPHIFFETSRGCWWGERMHCTFCGLNGLGMAYRSKSARRALDELAHLTARHPGCEVQVTDNILDMAYFKEFLPGLAARGAEAGLYWETKANLKKDHLRALRDAGVGIVQPGIESFSDPVLKLMRKGVSALQNVQLLKWCRELGLVPYWNVLWGFAGEPEEEYARMAALVPLLTHLPPPQGFGGIRLDRFSPNFFDAERLGYTDVRPLPAYRHVYPLPEDALANLACYFGFAHRDGRDVDRYALPLWKALRAWQRAADESALFFVDTGELLCLWDLRPVSRTPLTVLGGLDRLLYLACDAATGEDRLAEIARGHGHPLAASEVGARLAPLREGGLLVTDGGRHLALAVPLGEAPPPAPAVARFRELVRSLGRRESGGVVVPLKAPAARNPRRRTGAHVRPRRAAPALTRESFSVDGEGNLLVR